MAKKLLQKLSTTADLDTSAPVSSDLTPGTLVEAKDLSSQFWGPRKGSLAFTRVWEGPGVASLYDKITFSGTGTYARARSFEEQFRDLGTAWTLDLWFQLQETAYSAAETVIGLYQYTVGSGEIAVWIRGNGHASVGKVAVSITTTPTRSTADTTRTISGATAVALGTDQNDKTHIRIVRDGSTATLYVNGVSDGTTTELVSSSPLYGTVGSGGVVKIASSVTSPTTEATFKGAIYGALLRDGAYDTQPIEATMCHAPWSRNVHHYYLGREVTFTSGADHIFDAGRFGVHMAFVNGSGYTTTASNDNRSPTPALVQGMRTWTTRTNRTATSVMVGGQLNTKIIS